MSEAKDKTPDQTEEQKQLAKILENQRELAETLETLKSENEALKKQLETVASTGAAEAAQEEEPKVPGESFTVGRKKFKFAHAKFIVPAIGPVTALEALASKAEYKELADANGKPRTIQQYLVDIGSGLVEEVA
jgi:hypothetical protein